VRAKSSFLPVLLSTKWKSQRSFMILARKSEFVSSCTSYYSLWTLGTGQVAETLLNLSFLLINSEGCIEHYIKKHSIEISKYSIWCRTITNKKLTWEIPQRQKNLYHSIFLVCISSSLQCLVR
jgi:hypothetical protein